MHPPPRSRTAFLTIFAALGLAADADAGNGTITGFDSDSNGTDDKATVNLSFYFAFPPLPGDIAKAEEQLKRASQILCDATEGQLSLANVTLGTTGLAYEQADVFWYPEGALVLSGGSSAIVWGEYGNGVRIDGAGKLTGSKLAHELGHALLGLKDAYDVQRDKGRAFGFGPSFDFYPQSSSEEPGEWCTGPFPTRATEMARRRPKHFHV